MEVTQLTGDMARSVLETLIKEGRLLPVDLELALRQAVPNELKRMTDMVHQLLCKRDHVEELAVRCRYYEEDQLDSAWVEDAHVYWLDRTIHLLREIDIPSENQLKAAISMARKLNLTIHEGKDTSPAGYKLWLKMNGWEEPK